MAKEVTCTKIATYYEKTVKNTTVRLQIVKWNEGKPVLEKREYWKDGEGKEMTGKAKSLTLEDFDLILTKAADIRSKMV